MTLRLIDVQAGFGGATPGQRDSFDAPALAAALAQVRIERALTRLTPEQFETDVERSNDRLFAAAAAHPPFIPCPVIVPATAGDLPSEPDQADAFIRRGARAVTIRPAADAWIVADWLSDPLFRALEERRLPLFVLESLVPAEKVAAIAGRFPALPVILAGVGYRSQRILMPLLDRFPNVRLSTGSNFCVHAGIDQAVSRFGPGRLLFGTGLPAAEPMAAIAQLAYAEIPDEARARIGALNFESLAEAIIR